MSITFAPTNSVSTDWSSIKKVASVRVIRQADGTTDIKMPFRRNTYSILAESASNVEWNADRGVWEATTTEEQFTRLSAIVNYRFMGRTVEVVNA